jgi:hypothetical protein
MNFRDALVADHGADRMPVDMDRRLRRRLGLEVAGTSRRAWVWPAIAGFAVAAVALAVLVYPKPQSHIAPQSASVTITASPGTRVTKTSENTILLTHGSIELERKDATPLLVDVPMGRVVIAAYHSTVTVQPESMTILLDDGTGHYDDANGQSHALAPKTLFRWPPPTTKTAIPAAPTPATVSPAGNRASGRAVAPPHLEQQESPPGETPPSAPPAPQHADMPCTFKSDCDDGQTCRKNERGESVCMGKGGEGAACWFDNDCLSQHCAQRRCAAGE